MGSSSSLNNPYDVAVDSTGNIFITDMNCRIRLLDTSGIMSTVIGNGTCGFSGDNGPATSARLSSPICVTLDVSGNKYICDGNRIRKVDSSGIVTTFAGTGVSGFGGDNGPATAAKIHEADKIVVNGSNVLIADFFNNRIRMVYSISAPTSQPSNQPSIQPICRPSAQPSMQPRNKPTFQPTSLPTRLPSLCPISVPTNDPTKQPVVSPSSLPSNLPSYSPVSQPTSQPTISPTFQPFRLPSTQPTSTPSLNPTNQPSSSPSIAPLSKPSSTPTIQPNSAPSMSPELHPTVQPSDMPSMHPSEQPTSCPSVIPSAQPFSEPTTHTLQPFMRPSSYPSNSPSVKPSFHPSLQPSSSPSNQPVHAPSSQPSRQPLPIPTNVPTLMPSTQPSSYPTKFPSSFPTSSPTINGSNCANNTYYDQLDNQCKLCPELSSTLGKIGQLSCICNAGSFQSGSGLQLNCTTFQPGEYSSAGDRNCSKCSAGSFSVNSLSSTCTLCPIGFYNPLLGSVSSNSCLSPLPNFITGFFSLFLVGILCIAYIIGERFRRLSFERKFKYVIPLAIKCKEIMRKLENSSATSQSSDRNTGGMFTVRVQSNKFIVFILFCVCFSLVYAVFFYVALIYQVFFTTLILWRGVHLSINLPFVFTQLALALKQLSDFLHLPSNLLLYFAYPFILFFDSLASLKLNMNTINVTCQGAQAPLELLVDCGIFGIVIIFICSDYQLLFNLSLPSLNHCFLMHAMDKRRFFSNINVYYCLLILVFNNMNIFQVILRYIIGFININSFVASGYGTHSISPACDQLNVAPHFDSFLGYGATALAYWLILPSVFVLAHVLVPKRVSNNIIVPNIITNQIKENQEISKDQDEDDDLHHALSEAIIEELMSAAVTENEKEQIRGFSTLLSNHLSSKEYSKKVKNRFNLIHNRKRNRIIPTPASNPINDIYDRKVMLKNIHKKLFAIGLKYTLT
eukprot:gene10891-14617_t